MRPSSSHRLTTQTRYQVAVAGLLTAVFALSVTVVFQQVRIQCQLSVIDSERGEARHAREALAAAQARIENIESGGVIPRGAREAVAREVAGGGTILSAELGDVAPLPVKPALPDAGARDRIIGGVDFYHQPIRTGQGEAARGLPDSHPRPR